MKFVYHGSPMGGLKLIKPRMSTHGKAYIYALPEKAEVVMFFGRNYDLICSQGWYLDVPYLWERFEGALEYAYGGQKGSVYTLPADTFHPLHDRFATDKEMVSEVAVKPVSEEVIDDALVALRNMAKEKELLIFNYPNRPDFLPDRGKDDLIQKTIMFTNGDADHPVVADVRQFHPDILDRVLDGIRAKQD